MDKSVRPEIYGVMPVAQVESLLRNDKMPAPFTRRMRVINLLSALTLRKIDDDMIAPFNVMDIHHILDEQISQDAIIAMLENKNLALALETGDMQPLWAESKEETLLRRGFNQKWIQRFITTPFDPVCVMLAMRAKLMLDVVDELGHSYNLLRALGMGWIDFGEIPGEDPGNPDNYIPPLIDQPIDDPDVPPAPPPDNGEPAPEPGDPDYIPPGDQVPGHPDHVPGPDEPDYVPPPDRVPGDPGYEGVPGEPPGYPEGWDEAIHPGHPDYDPGPGDRGYYAGPSPGGGLYGGDFGPGGKGTPGGPYGGGGDFASLLPPLPLGYGPGWLLSGRGFGESWISAGINCCLNYLDPLENVSIESETDTMGYSETQTLKVQNYDPSCDGDNYEWMVTGDHGAVFPSSGLEVEYTAPADGTGCPAILQVVLYCNGEIMDTVNITFDYLYLVEWDYDNSAAEIDRNGNESIYVMANNTPLTWAVSGTGFTLRDETTNDYENVLYADETACGSATITVTGCFGVSTTGYVRCTEGHWDLKSNTCVMSGEEATEVEWRAAGFLRAARIQGNKKQIGYYSDKAHDSGWKTSCGAAMSEACDGAFDCLTFDVPCADVHAECPVNCAPRVCRAADCIKHPNEEWWYIDAWNFFEGYSSNPLKYYEWEC